MIIYLIVFIEVLLVLDLLTSFIEIAFKIDKSIFLFEPGILLPTGNSSIARKGAKMCRC